LLAPSIEKTHARSNAEQARVRLIGEFHAIHNSIVSRYNSEMSIAKTSLTKCTHRESVVA
jgi:hypothetical protein